MESYTLAAHSRLTDDPGPVPGVLNLEQAAKRNHNFRTVLWTGKHFQLTVMCIPFRGEIGLELHPDTDQLIRVEDGQARIRMGENREQMEHCHCLRTGDVILIPKGTWHNVFNTGNRMLKLSSVYAPAQHPRGTVHPTKADAERGENPRFHFPLG